MGTETRKVHIYFDNKKPVIALCSRNFKKGDIFASNKNLKYIKECHVCKKCLANFRKANEK